MLPIHDDEVLIIDPPSGWRYGFPKVWTGDTYKMLRDANYPEIDIPFAISHCRFWTEVKQ